MKIELVLYAVLGIATFVGTIVLWGDYPPSIGQHLLPLSGMLWTALLARVLDVRARFVHTWLLGYLVVAAAAYAGAVAHHTHVIYASICYFAMTLAGSVLFVHAYRRRVDRWQWRVVAIVLALLTLDALRYAIVLLVRWLSGRTA